MTQDIAAVAEAAVDPHERERRVLLIDGTTVSMTDTPERQQAYPQNRQQKPGVGFPQARIVGMVSLSSACVLHWRVSACQGPHSHESQQLWALLDEIQPGDIVVADRAYASYFLLAALAERGATFVIRQHQRRRSDQANARRLGEADHLVSWPKPQRPPWMAHSTYARLPDHLTIREERIICHVLPSRPDRVEPRANKRRPKQQRYLNQPRDIARQALQEA